MQIIVLADEEQRHELANHFPPDVRFISSENEFLAYKDADAFVDLQFIDENGRKDLLTQLLPKPVIVNSVISTLDEIHPSFARINAWPTFLSSPLIEAACRNEAIKQTVEEVFSSLNKKIEWLADEPGFLTARVVSMIINEAFLALSEGVSTKEEINTAMKLGTAYPYGPFEWAEKIGVQNIVALLSRLSETQPRYTVAALLVQEANSVI